MTPLTVISLKPDCRHFRGDIPCKPHKFHGVHCPGCPLYEPTDGRVLVIKLGAIGDVIRTTPILHKLKEVYPRHAVWWVTETTDVVPETVDVRLPWNDASILALQHVDFDLVLSLEKDLHACALAMSVPSKRLKGFILKNGKCAPIDGDADHKYLTGVFDDLNKENTKSYPEEIFELSGFRFSGEKYVLRNFADDGYAWKLPKKKKIVGLNTGCGGRWPSRLWPDAHWVALARSLGRAGYTPLLLGGEEEQRKNLRIAKASGALYPGHFPLRQFINLVDQCRLVVTAVTMAMHIAIGLEKKIVLFNNIFNRNEFELYGLGEILEPTVPCDCFYARECPKQCMRSITPKRVLETVQCLLPAK